MNTFSPTAAISFGWNIFKANVGFSLIILAIIVVPQIIVSSLTGSGPKNPEDINAFFGVSLFANLILSLVSAVVALGVTKALLNLVDTGKGNVSDVLIPFKQPKMVLNFFLAYLLIFGVVILLVPVMVVLGVLTLGLGFLVLIPLAIFLGFAYSFFTTLLLTV